MKRVWQDDPILKAEIEDAMQVAQGVDFDDFCFDNCLLEGDNQNKVLRKGSSDDEDDKDVEIEGQEHTELDAEYVKNNFDRLYVEKVVRWVDQSLNVFVTGSQGRGKSTCIGRVIGNLYRKGCSVLVTGSTGASVVNISDVAHEGLKYAVDNDLIPSEVASVLAPSTFHSAFGLKKVDIDCLNELKGAVKEDPEKQQEKEADEKTVSEIAKKFMASYAARHNDNLASFIKSGRHLPCIGVPSIAYAQVLFIDEISMLGQIEVAIGFKLIEYWSGPPKNMTVVFVGDFQQLPPVRSGTRQNPIYLFENVNWTTKKCRQGWVDRVLHLKTNIRQEGDLQYGQLLDRMAMNSLTMEDIMLLRSCVLRPMSGNGYNAALNPFVMPGVIRVFNSVQAIKQFTAKVMRNIDENKRVTLKYKQEYNPAEEDIFKAYGREKVHVKVKDFLKRTTANMDREFYLDCPVRFLENKDIEQGVVNGAIGKFKRCAGKDPVIELKNGKEYTLLYSSAEIFLDEYTNRQRREIEEGNIEAEPGRPVARLTLKYYPIKMALALTPHALQGCTLESAIIHPSIDPDNKYTTIECLYVALSRLRHTGLDNPLKTQTLRAIPWPTLHPEPSEDDPRPVGLYLTRFEEYPFYVRQKVRDYIDNIEQKHSSM